MYGDAESLGRILKQQDFDPDVKDGQALWLGALYDQVKTTKMLLANGDPGYFSGLCAEVQAMGNAARRLIGTCLR